MPSRTKKAAKATTMTKCDSQKQRKTIPYPDHTKGTEAAAQARQEANTLGEDERKELFERGMQIIYGGSGKEKNRTRH